MFIGTLLLAEATSLPELFTTVNSIKRGVPELAAGNIFALSFTDLFYFRARFLGTADLP
jgi:Ca2+/Na+ antiporter